jgi:hypothetical protein
MRTGIAKAAVGQTHPGTKIITCSLKDVLFRVISFCFMPFRNTK